MRRRPRRGWDRARRLAAVDESRNSPIIAYRIKLPAYVGVFHDLGNRVKTRDSQFVIAGLVPAISIRRAQCQNYRDVRDKPGHDQIGTAVSFAAITALGSNDCYCSRLQWIDIMRPIAIGNYLLQREIPCSGIGNSLLGAEQGIARSALELQCKRTPEPGGTRRNGRRFSTFP